MTTMSPKRLPQLTRHKATGQGYVRLNGVCHYLGKFDDPETQQKALRLVAEWLANQKRLPIAPNQITVGEILAAYWQHCQGYYRAPDGSPAKSLEGIRQALRPVRALYGDLKAVEFGPNALRTVTRTWIDAQLCRTTVNARIGAVKRMFKWAVSHEMIPPNVHLALSTVEGLHKGRSEAREPRKVPPVPQSHVDAVRPYVSRQVWGLIQLQLLTGARSGEILGLRRIDIDTSGKVWVLRPDFHKTSYINREREIQIGPRAQAVLREFLVGKGPIDYVFSPKDARKEKGEGLPSRRRPDQKPTPCRTERKIGEHYTVCSYHRAITRACDEAGIPRWHPHQLRHVAATNIRREFGLEAAQAVLGHARADVTQIYAEVNREKAIAVISAIG